MTIRAILCGLILALGIACGTYFNDFVMRQTMIIATHFPVAVFGPVLIALLAVGPLLKAMRAEPLRPTEVAVIVAIGLAACAWPGSGFWRYAPSVSGTPGYWYRTAPSWQAQGVMSYVPGGSAELAQGQVFDWPKFGQALVAAGEQGGDRVPAALWRAIGEPAQNAARSLAREPQRQFDDRRVLLPAVNQALHDRALFASVAPGALPADAADHDVVAHNRTVLAEAMPELVAPLPQGEGAILPPRNTAAIDTLLAGTGAGVAESFDAVPWSAWWPTLRLWAGVALALGLGTLCLALIVHPQWSRRELLSYPIARFVEEIGQREPNRGWPAVAYHRAFWIALAGVLAVHVINGLDVWFNTGVKVMLNMPFGPLRSLFPDASRVPLSFGLFEPRIYFTVIAFAFFLPQTVSLSLGLAQPLFVAVGAVMLANGLTWEYDKTEPSKTAFLRLGAFIGMALIILYTGRRYYGNVAASAVGFPRFRETPAYATWAARGFVASVAAGVALLVSGGLGWDLAILLVALFTLTWLVTTRIVCETGSFFVTNPYYPATIVTGLLGFEAMGPSGFLLITMASWVLMADPRESLMPYVANALHMVDRGGVSPGRASKWLVLACVASLVVAGVATLTLQYQHGLLSMSSEYSKQWVPSVPFERLSAELARTESLGTLQSAVQAAPITRFSLLNPWDGAAPWTGIGLALVVGCAAARLRLPWWPIHPVLFLMWGTYANANFAFSFFIGWLIKVSVTGLGGAKAYHNVKPIMVGIVSGELLAMGLWTVVGATYYLVTGQPPSSYTIFPG